MSSNCCRMPSLYPRRRRKYAKSRSRTKYRRKATKRKTYRTRRSKFASVKAMRPRTGDYVSPYDVYDPVYTVPGISKPTKNQKRPISSVTSLLNLNKPKPTNAEKISAWEKALFPTKPSKSGSNTKKKNVPYEPEPRVQPTIVSTIASSNSFTNPVRSQTVHSTTSMSFKDKVKQWWHEIVTPNPYKDYDFNTGQKKQSTYDYHPITIID